MLQPLMALLAVTSLGAAEGTATQARCTVDTGGILHFASERRRKAA